MKKRSFFTLIVLAALLVAYALGVVKHTQWNVQSIDTMKYSRDPSREKLHDPKFDKVIDQQLFAIAQTGATHVGIATPYDDEFLPIMKRWVQAARKYHLKVWFRGNLSGWEGWFEYKKIDRKTHIAQTKRFILENKELFKNGDIFTSCPECENGSGANFGDDVQVAQYRAFLIEEYTATKNAFKSIGKNVKANYYSMNGDVARRVMDRQTTKALDGIVTIDHYVGTGDQLAKDIKEYAKNSGGRVVLGEFGAPIPDINGPMSDAQQKAWLEDTLEKLSGLEELEGINYWVNVGGSTAIWNDNGTPKPAVETLTKFYSK